MLAAELEAGSRDPYRARVGGIDLATTNPASSRFRSGRCLIIDT